MTIYITVYIDSNGEKFVGTPHQLKCDADAECDELRERHSDAWIVTRTMQMQNLMLVEPQSQMHKPYAETD